MSWRVLATSHHLMYDVTLGKIGNARQLFFICFLLLRAVYLTKNISSIAAMLIALKVLVELVLTLDIIDSRQGRNQVSSGTLYY